MYHSIHAYQSTESTGKILDSSPKMEYNIHVIKLVSILFFLLQTAFDMLSLKGKYNKSTMFQ